MFSNWPEFQWNKKLTQNKNRFFLSEKSVKKLMRGYTIVKNLKMREIIELEKEFPVLSIPEW